MRMMKETSLLDILKAEVTPALGCTEPIAVAYAVAKAKETFSGQIENLKIIVDRNILKNAMGVGIPGTNKKGLKIAAALALIAGKSRYKLEVLKEITAEDVKKAEGIMAQGILDVSTKKDARGIYIEVIARGSGGSVRVIIEDKHDNITMIEKNGKIIYKKDLELQVDYVGNIRSFTIAELIQFAQNVSLDKIQFVRQGIEMNKRMAQAGLENGAYYNRSSLDNKENFKEYAKTLTSAACHARMSGFPLPVMSCAGSGNHGLTAILPVVAVGEAKCIDMETVIRGVTISLLVTIYVKSFTGTLSAVCGCGVAAGVGACAGITFILGGTLNQIEGAINNMIGGISGIICDGGKPGCAFKLSISSGTAVEAALMALNNVFISHEDGIVDQTAEKSIYNLGEVSTKGMQNTDETILKVMMQKCP
jgi:L-cysteine desulfidase